MRAIFLFVGGILSGLAIQFAVAQSQNQGIVQVNHVGIAFEDLDAAITYYTETLGYPEAFRVTTDSGAIALVYVQVSRNTFVELQPVTDERPAGLNHFGIVVDDMDAVTEMFKQRGADVADSFTSSTNAVLSNVFDPWGNRMELAELPSGSLHYQAMEAWQ